VLHPNVTVYDNVDIGRGAILHSGAVIGADGFGYVMEHGRWQKFPQVGRVEIGDFVEIGANSCVDRAALGVTEIGEGTKLDNMVHVAHNCRIGKHVVVAAQTGFSGGVVVEDYAVIGGQVGIGDKARIESRAVLGSGCGVLTSKIVHSGETVWGTPARPLKTAPRAASQPGAAAGTAARSGGAESGGWRRWSGKSEVGQAGLAAPLAGGGRGFRVMRAVLARLLHGLVQNAHA